MTSLASRPELFFLEVFHPGKKAWVNMRNPTLFLDEDSAIFAGQKVLQREKEKGRKVHLRINYYSSLSEEEEFPIEFKILPYVTKWSTPDGKTFDTAEECLQTIFEVLFEEGLAESFKDQLYSVKAIAEKAWALAQEEIGIFGVDYDLKEEVDIEWLRANPPKREQLEQFWDEPAMPNRFSLLAAHCGQPADY